MKKPILFLSIALLFGDPVMAETQCFLAKENNQIIKQEGRDCKTRYAPESTFKVALSLMGYDAGILNDEVHPEWPFKKGYDDFINVWKSPHNPHSWMRDSCVWYSQVLTQKLGLNKFKEYVVTFNYGNQDVSGDKGKNNGLTHAWLSSSLNISPVEQVAFLQKMVDGQLPVSQKSIAMTKKIMFVQELPGGWTLYGKTGNGKQLDSNGLKTELQHGWFLGWIEKNGRMIIFANHITDEKKQDIFASFRVRNETLIKLWYLINELEH
jgi:beta-lactamase class D OXA-29